MNYITISVTLQSPYLSIGAMLHTSVNGGGGAPPAPVFDAETANHILITE